MNDRDSKLENPNRELKVRKFPKIFFGFYC